MNDETKDLILSASSTLARPRLDSESLQNPSLPSFLHSRCQWEPQQLFPPILKRALAYCPQRLVGVAIDLTRIIWTNGGQNQKLGRGVSEPMPQAYT
jgi:hypothetical protein